MVRRPSRPKWAERLRAERQNRLWSQDDLASALEKEAAAVNKRLGAALPARASILRRITDYEAGKHQPRDPYRTLYCRVFGMSEAELFAEASTEASTPQVAEAPMTFRRDFRHPDGNQSMQTGTTEPDSKERLILSADEIFGANQVDADYVQAIRESNQHFVAIDGLCGGKDILPLAVRTFRAAHGKLGSASLHPAIQRDLEAAAGEAGEVAAWLAYDADHQSLSRQIIHEALFLSRLAGDREMELFELTHLAMQSIYLHRPREAMRIADDVQDDAQIPPRVVALFDIRRGRALAQYGERERALRTLDKARSALDDSITTRDPKWTWWLDEAEVIGHKATAHAELGEWHNAVPLLKEAADLRQSSRRSSYYASVHFLDSLVRVHAWGEAEQTMINDVMPKAQEIGSIRTTNLLLRTIERIEKARTVATSTLVDSAADLRQLLHRLNS
ncbi:multiprotein-bridging factor 1 family protein [Nonomuraea purpurea]|uniref:Multiprotein-bridging factor 1 family protein n=1 Tax=Nonomuraea purpurea TaxID=1849276 RepID=A0ABV8GHU5_9ACTN